MHSLLSRHYWWPGMRTDICHWCRACIICVIRQAGRSVQPPLIPTPFFMLYGQDPVLPTEEALSQPVKRCYLEYDDYRAQMVRNLSEAWTTARQNVQKAQKQQKRQHDKKTRMLAFIIGDSFCLYACCKVW